jgi:uncharacterized protein YacL
MNVRREVDVETLLIWTLGLLIGLVVLSLLGKVLSILLGLIGMVIEVLVPVLVLAVLVLTVLWLVEQL